MWRIIVTLLLCLFALESCSSGLETIGTITIPKTSFDTLITRQLTLDLEKGEIIELWNDMSIESRQKLDVEIHYGLEQMINGKPKGGLKLDALKTNPTLQGAKQRARGRLVWSFEGKMTYIQVEETGKYTFKAALFTSDKDLILHKAKLIFKKRS